MRVLALSIVALMLGAQAYPPPFPRDGATRLIDNDRVAVWDVSWPKGRPTAMHRHTSDLVGVFLADGSRIITGPDGSRTPSLSKAGQAVFSPKGVTHTEEGTSDQPARAILIELKSDGPAGAAEPNPGMRAAFPRDGATLLLENARVAVWAYKWSAGATVPTHQHIRDAVVIWFEGGTLLSTPAAGPPAEVVAAVGQARFSPRGTIHSEAAIQGAPRAVVIELK